MQIDPKGKEVGEIYRLMISAIVPRPIAFISTVSKSGVLNLAPFSYFMGVCSRPPTIAVSIIERPSGPKDTANNIQDTAQFTVNIVTEEIAEKMNIASGDYPPEVDEFKMAGLTPMPSTLITPPRVAESPISMECRLVEMSKVGESPYASYLTLGEVLLFHIQDELWADGEVDVRKLLAIGRMSGPRYTKTRDIFEMPRPRIKRE
ncbi:MAG TPA: flavin reductase family protein [Verrucomicrobiae bacterium]|nr:flavin reductase family protein [Verrucomicrobiae bacterium]